MDVRIGRALALSAGVLALSGSALFADRFGDSLAAANANLATAEGREYAARIAARFDEKSLRAALSTCLESASEEDKVPFTVLIDMTGDGRASQVLLRPPTPVAICLRWTIRETSFPRPPSVHYWVSAPVDPKRAPGAPPIPTPGVATATVPPTPTPAAPLAPAAVATPTPASPTDAIVDFGDGATPIRVLETRPDLAALRRSLRDSRARALGPILAQADGVAPDDPRLEPYWSLAEELDLPVILLLGPEAGDDTKYRIALGDPLKLESVLQRHPKLRVVVSQAAWPFGDAIVALMWRYPRVWVDTRMIAWSLPRTELDAYLARLIQAGCGDRILFAAGGGTPQRLADAVAAIQASSSLTPAQKRAVLHDNAERLLSGRP